MVKIYIPGEGPTNANVMIIGEAGGSEEELQRKPFVGRSGKLLDKMLKSLSINRKELYITNVVKFRPPNNRKPTKKEIARYSSILISELNNIKPKLVITLGSTASNFMLKESLPINKSRGILYKKGLEFEILPTFHPSYVLRNPEKKSIFLNDLSIMRKYL